MRNVIFIVFAAVFIGLPLWGAASFAQLKYMGTTQVSRN